MGGGLSGLAAACFYRRRFGPSARVLVLDNHDDFGGHARRNEFVSDGRTLMTTGGSAYFVAPDQWTDQAKEFVRSLGADFTVRRRKPALSPRWACGLQPSCRAKAGAMGGFTRMSVLPRQRPRSSRPRTCRSACAKILPQSITARSIIWRA
ncbi:NAD(P)-binding protein [Komagataeibacter nataicola]|uniref:NAD(P)-binding protein n=1 Tax=Komagataeibacter nataicola TaxID=265960 RepID=UPI0038D0DC0F